VASVSRGYTYLVSIHQWIFDGTLRTHLEAAEEMLGNSEGGAVNPVNPRQETPLYSACSYSADVWTGYALLRDVQRPPLIFFSLTIFVQQYRISCSYLHCPHISFPPLCEPGPSFLLHQSVTAMSLREGNCTGLSGNRRHVTHVTTPILSFCSIQ
jgi:hypothetical protein